MMYIFREEDEEKDDQKNRVFTDVECHNLSYLFIKLCHHHKELKETYYNDTVKLFLYHFIETINYSAVEHATA